MSKFTGILATLFCLGFILFASGVSAAEETEKNDAEVASAEDLHDDDSHDESEHDHGGKSHDAEDHGDDGHGSNEHHSGEHHDLSHGAASEALYSAVDPRADTGLFTLIVFGVLCAALYAVAWKPVTKALDAREEKIAGDIERAEKAATESEAKLAEYESKLEAAKSEASELIAQAKKDAEAAGQRIVSEAQEEASRQRDRAVAEIEAAKVSALSDISSKSTDLAFGMARNIVGRELKKDDHKSLVDQALSSLTKQN